MPVQDPRTLCLEAGSGWTPDAPLRWLPATRLRDGEQVLVPADLLASRPVDLAHAPGPRLTTVITHGLGAGLDPDRALSHALLELLQRDGNGLVFRALDRGVLVDLDGLTDPAALQALRRLREAGVEPLVKLASTAFGVTGVYAVGVDAGAGGEAVSVTACGEAAHPDREVAVRKALLELCSSRARKAFAHGSLDRVRALTGDYLDRYLAALPADALQREEPRALSAMAAWLRLGPQELGALLAGSVLSRRAVVPLSSLPTTPGLGSTRALREDVVDRLSRAGLDVLVLDLSGEGVSAVKAVVPGLEVETMSYGRIGERGVRRALDLGPAVRRRRRRPGRLVAGAPDGGGAGAPRRAGLARPGRGRRGRRPALPALPRAGPAPRAARPGGPRDRPALRLQHQRAGPPPPRRRAVPARRHRLRRGRAHPRRAPPRPVRRRRAAPRPRGCASGSTALCLEVVVETGARYLLDPRAKHEPTLVTGDPEGRARRLAYLRRACDLAEVLRAEAVSFWAGRAPGGRRPRPRRGAGSSTACARSSTATATPPYSLAVEPEPGMLVEDCDDWQRLHDAVPGTSLALDTGHCVVSGAYAPEQAVAAFAPHLGTVAVEGMRRGVHDHLPLDEGDVDLPAVLGTLARQGYDRLVTLELSRDSHRAHEMVPRAMATLEAAEQAALA